MDIRQRKTEFQPITITLETAEEANAFWDILNACSPETLGMEQYEAAQAMCKKMSNWLSNTAQGLSS